MPKRNRSYARRVCSATTIFLKVAGAVTLFIAPIFIFVPMGVVIGGLEKACRIEPAQNKRASSRS